MSESNVEVLPAESGGRDWVAVVKMLFLGFASGLPFPLVLTTLSARLRQAGIDRTTIGLFSLVGLAYSLKFFWSPIVDRWRLPGLGALGQRRSWMLFAQFGVIAGLIAMALHDPASGAQQMALLATLTAFCAATQDIAVDAYRIESAGADWQGATVATYQIGYQVALICSGAIALLVASHQGWTGAYFLMAALMLVGPLTTLIVAEPAMRIARGTAVDPVLLEATIRRMRPSALVVAVAVTVAGGIAGDFERGFGEGGAFLRAAAGVGLVVDRTAAVAVEAHGTIAVIVHDGAARGVDGEGLVVDAEAVALGVGVGEDAGLEHLVGRVADAWDNVRRSERDLLDLGVVIRRVAVKFKVSDVDQWVIGVRPNFGEIEGVDLVAIGIGLGHDLDGEAPAGEIAVGDGVKEIGLSGFAVLADDDGGFLIGVVGVALQGLKMEFHPGAFADGVDETVGVRAVAVDLAVIFRKAAVAEEGGELMERLGGE